MGNLARILGENGGAAEAESLTRAALLKLDSAKAGQRPQYISHSRTLGAALLTQRRTDEALPFLERALDMSRRQFGETDWRTAHAQLSYGNALLAKQRYGDAEPLLRAAQATLQKHRVDQPRLAAQASTAIAMLPALSSR